jgi:signal transduction histidine kinase
MMSPQLMPHAVCWREDPRLIWTMAITNAITFLSYSSICATLIFLARKTRHAIARDWVYFLLGFALFIVACGSTHLLEVITTWTPVFWVDAWTNIITALLSGYVAVQFFRRSSSMGDGINDYAARLQSAELEKARVEESLLAARRLEEWNRMSAVVTHEIGNPLAAIQNMLYLIEMTPDVAPEVVALAKSSSHEAMRIGELTRSTLGFFRQDQRPDAVDLRASAESVRFLLEPLLRQRALELVIESEGECTVRTYAVEPRQVLLNLARNACEATPHGGAPVRIFLRGEADAVRVTVEDAGSGIEPALLPNLFGFGVSTKGERGNGLGLWAVKQLVTRNGGTISVESTPGKGTRFTAVWPRKAADETLERRDLARMALTR